MDDQQREAEKAQLRRRLQELETPTPTAPATKPRRKQNFGGLAIGAVISVGGAVLGISALSNQSADPGPVANAMAQPATPWTPSNAATADAPISLWQVDETKDELRDKVTKTACVHSENKVDLDFPYMDVTASLCIRRSPKYGLDAYLALDGDGQILCDHSDGCSLPVRFGKATVQTFSGAGSADLSTNVVFLKSASRVIAGLRKADTTMVEIQLYQAGQQRLDFPTAGFKWP